MKTSNKQLVLVKGSLELLRQVRAELHSESDHSLGSKIDDVIEQLEDIERTEVPNSETLDRVLFLLGQGFAAIPSIVKIIESFSNR